MCGELVADAVAVDSGSAPAAAQPVKEGRNCDEAPVPEFPPRKRMRSKCNISPRSQLPCEPGGCPPAARRAAAAYRRSAATKRLWVCVEVSNGELPCAVSWSQTA